MNWITVDSSLITAIAYEGTTLYVRFSEGGAEYQYTGVPESVWNEFLAAPSKGKFFLANIKGKYDYKLS